MPPKGARARTANLGNLQKARDANPLNNPAAPENLESVVIRYQQQLADMEAQITSLEVKLEKSDEECSKLSELLAKAEKYIGLLESDLKREKDHSKDIYRQLRNERRAQQCASK